MKKDAMELSEEIMTASAAASGLAIQGQCVPEYESPPEKRKQSSDNPTAWDFLKSVTFLFALFALPFILIAIYTLYLRTILGPSWIWWTLFIIVPVALVFFFLSIYIDELR